jgi:hypothetical protein
VVRAVVAAAAVTVVMPVAAAVVGAVAGLVDPDDAAAVVVASVVAGRIVGPVARERGRGECGAGGERDRRGRQECAWCAMRHVPQTGDGPVPVSMGFSYRYGGTVTLTAR